MLQKPKTCSGCSLERTSRSFSIPEGNCKTGVMIVGEALGDKEAFDSLPFRPSAEAGSVLQSALRLLYGFDPKFDRLQFGLWNLVACQPPYNKLENAEYEESAINHCKVHFNNVFARFKPKVILALGNLPLKYLWKRDSRIDNFIQEMNGKIAEAKEAGDKDEAKKLKKTLTRFRSKTKISSMRGYTLPSIYGIPMVASLHPSGINREGRVHIGTLMRDIYHAVNIAKGIKYDFKTNYIEKPTLEQAEQFFKYVQANPHLPLSIDTETPETSLEVDESDEDFINKDVREMKSIQFALKIGEGIFFPFEGQYIDIAGKILGLENPKIGWNIHGFDEAVIEYYFGIGSIKGKKIDLMDAWHHLNSDFNKVGRALQFATPFYAPEFPAWKHLAQIEKENYGILDVDAPQRILQGITKDFERRLEPTDLIRNLFGNTWFGKETKTLQQGFDDDIISLRPILRDIEIGGLPIDEVERNKFRKRVEILREGVLNELQDLYPNHLKKSEPELGYKNIPSEVKTLTEQFTAKLNFQNNGDYFLIEEASVSDRMLQQYIELHSRAEEKEMTGLRIKEFNIGGGLIEKRYCRVTKFKPSSSQQVIKYLKFKKYKVPKKRGAMGVETETTEKDQIHKLWEETNDPLLERIVLFRELNKMQNTYAGGGKKEGWKVGIDGRVHTTFTFLTATGQLSSRNPNIQNAPARGTRFSSQGYKQLAKDFRKIVAAGPGKVIISADWSSFHALTLGFEAEDETYIRLVRHDVHSYVAAWILNQELPNKLPFLKRKKPDNQSKEDWISDIAKAEEAITRLRSISSWLTLPDSGLKEQLTWIKSNYKFTRDSQAKPAILGMGFGMGVRKFFKLNRYSFRNESEPRAILELIRKLFPKVFVDYHKNIKQLASEQTYLLSRYGHIRRFYDVYDWRILRDYRAPKFDEVIVKGKDGRYWCRKDGVNARDSIAYLPANDAFGKKKEAIRDLWAYEKDGIVRNIVKDYRMINEIHDSLDFETDEDKVEDAAFILKEVMESPSRHLKNSVSPNGLVCKIELKVGKNWAPFDKFSNSNGMQDFKL